MINDKITEVECDNTIQQLPKPFIIPRGFNGYNEIWRSKEINRKDKIIECLIWKRNL